jgi:hypothetical protein
VKLELYALEVKRRRGGVQGPSSAARRADAMARRKPKRGRPKKDKYGLRTTGRWRTSRGMRREVQSGLADMRRRKRRLGPSASQYQGWSSGTSRRHFNNERRAITDAARGLF